MSEPRTFLDGRVVLHAGDCREVLKGMADNSVDSVVTDPPYGINFMNRKWDGNIAFQTELWSEVLRVLKPGGYIMAFSGCRTYHRMACAIEDAGFITHPMFAWVFGSGFPKAHNLSKQLDKMAGVEREIIGSMVTGNAKQRTSKTGEFSDGNHGGTQIIDITTPATDAAREWDGWFYGTQSLKPALEPIYFGQKPFERGLNGAQNVLKWGTGAINVGACRVGTNGGMGNVIAQLDEYQNKEGGWGTKKFVADDTVRGRWPANLILDGSDDVLACFPESVGQHSDVNGYKRFNGVYANDDSRRTIAEPRDDSGSAARFFYTSKAGVDDRLGSRHPTVKPLDLIQYFVRLNTPKNGVCLDLFAGTATTAEACFREGFRCILIEREAEYIADIERRMSLVMEGPVTRAHAGMKARGRSRDDGPLFGGGNADREYPSASLKWFVGNKDEASE